MASQRADLSVNGWNAEYIETLYRQWKDQPENVDEPWRHFFRGFDLGLQKPAPEGEADGRTTGASASETAIAHTKQGRVDSLIYHYRDIGHLAASLDPLGFERPFPEQLTLESFDLTDADLDETFDPGFLPLDNPAPLREIIQLLEDTYCRHIGAEYMHIQNRDQRRWLQKRMETVRNRPPVESGHRKRILKQLLECDALEQFLDLRYKGKKWFSLSGGDSLIPVLHEIFESGPRLGAEEFSVGMAHRGRVNVLVNVFGKTYEELFTEFDEAWTEDYIEGGGDVKYHRGYSSNYTTATGQSLRLTIANNPSHLEFVYPVVLGRCRAKQRLRQNEDKRDKVVPVIMHGDASFPGQGIVAECLNMMRLKGYTVGGTVHIIINNQVGFTTDSDDARSGRYCTDLAKMVEAPIFHVNADDPEACAFVARLAMEYRAAFQNDVVIDLFCYRKFGHNETDEPAFTQPLMYERIRKKSPVAEVYAKQLMNDGVLNEKEYDDLRGSLRDRLDSAQSKIKEKPVDPTIDPFAALWAGLNDNYVDEPVQTGVEREVLAKVAKSIGTTPDDFEPHKRLQKNVLDFRAVCVEEDKPLDWGTAEMLAYGSLLLEGHSVRLTGQDVERGTFSHRHAVLVDQKTGAKRCVLNHIERGQAEFLVYNSPLSEQSCVGYEYGYSLTDPRMLIIWEAQFGDFVNGAQVIIDQFIASAEIKWQRHSGLVMLLPHGYEGQGPEHSSARLERLLQLCADDNMQVIYPTTPAQIFHALRNQMKRSFRKPMIVMSPKSLLRHPKAQSAVQDLTEGGFRRVLDDPFIDDPSRITRLLLCSGKVYYDLIAQREAVSRNDLAIVRIEQLHPLPVDAIREVLERYENASEIIWTQEEPANAGAFRYMQAKLWDELEVEVEYIGRPECASPAVGSSKIHEREQMQILEEAIGEAPSDDESSSDKKKPEPARAR